MAIASLVLGIAAFPGVCCYGLPAVALGVTALILGRVALGRIRMSNGMKGGAGLAQAGWICGLVAAVLGGLYLLFIVGLVGLSLSGVLPSPSPS